MASQRFVFTSVIFSRIAYALCWFDASAAYPQMAAKFHYPSIYVLGLVTAAFLIGAGGFQVPAGIFASRYGVSRSSLVGLLAIGLTSLASATSGNIGFQVILRFLTGIGAAFYFAPAMVVVSELLGQNRSASTIGAYNGAFSLGAALALLIFTPLSVAIDWRLPFIVTGILVIIALIENWFSFKGITNVPVGTYIENLKAIKNRTIWIVIVALIGLNAAYNIVSQFGVSYSEYYLGFSPSLSGIISALVLIGAFFGAPIGGYLSDRFGIRRQMIFAPVLVASVGILMLTLQSVYLVAIATCLFGFFCSASTSNGFAFVTTIPEIGRKYSAVAIGLMNSISIIAGSIAAILFTPLADLLGYPTAWAIIAVVAIGFTPFVFLVKEG